MSKDNGGAAFPSPGVVLEGGGQQGAYEGMTLRDYFAAKAMQGFNSNPQNDHLDHDEVATLSYRQADAMLAERSK